MPDRPIAAPAEPAPKPENTFRDVISLLAIVVTLTIGLLAYIQREPVFTYKVEVGFLLWSPARSAACGTSAGR